MRPRPPLLIFGRRVPLSLDEAFDLDAKAVLGVSESIFQALTDLIATQKGFLSAKGLRELLVRCVGDDQTAIRVADYITRLHAFMRERQQRPEEFLEDFGHALEERESERNRAAERLTADQCTQLLVRSKAVLLEESAVSRYWKARALAVETGVVLEGLSMVCDLRPVFDDARTSIDGMIPVITLKLVVAEANSLPTTFEVVLDEEQLSTLAKVVDGTQKQVTVLYAHLAAKNMPFPEILDS